MKNSMYSNVLFLPLIFVFVGIMVLAVNMGWLPSEMWRIWPAILILVGLIGLIGYMDGFKSSSTTSTKKSKPASKASKKARR